MHRFALLEAHFRTKADKSERAASERIQRNIENIIKVTSDPEVAVDELFKQAFIPPQDFDTIRNDVHRLRDAAVDNSTLVSFAAARILAANLIDDDLVEPLQQIRRIYSKEIAARFFPLQMLSPRPNAAARQEIRDEALAWQKRIRDEEGEKQIHTDRRRNSQRLAADASSLAYVQWIAERLESQVTEGKPRQRVVFVTGDTLLFDAYRRWWVQKADRPFALRRIAQYSPILNFKDAGSSIAFNREIFENTRRAIEPQLVYFNLAEPAMDQAPLAAPGRRSAGESGVMQSRALQRQGDAQHLALLLKGQDPLQSDAFKLFAKRVRDKVLNERKPDLSSIKNDWQDIERLAIGLYHELISRRLDEERRQQLRRFMAEPGGEGIDKFINGHLNDLYYYGAMLYVPEAFNALRRLARSPATVSNRAPIALRLRTSSSSANSPSQSATSLDVAEMAMTLVRGANVEDALQHFDELWLRNPERLFALVSTVALLLSLWDQAATYAQLAAGSQAAEAIKSRAKRDDRAEYFELLYLRALANRFRIGAISHAITDSELRAQHAFNAALDDLAACIEYHANPAGDGERHLLRETRARSERAALRGFYASWLLLHARRSGTVLDGDLNAIVHLLRLVREDLLSATEMLAVTEARARMLDATMNTQRLMAFFSRVAKQVNINTAALYVFGELTKRQRQDSEDELVLDPNMLAHASKVLKAQLAKQQLSDEVPEILVEVYLFLWLFERDAGSRERLRSLFSTSRDGMLNIDAGLLAAYKEAFGSELFGQDDAVLGEVR